MALLEEPIAEAVEPQAVVERKKRRWPWVVLGLVVVVLIAAFISAAVWVAHYQPVANGSGVYGLIPPVSQDSQLGIPGSVMTPYAWYVAETGTKNVVIKPKAGDKFSYRTELVNYGPFAVKITGIATVADAYSGWPLRTSATIAAGPDFGPHADTTQVPFRPFVLPGHGDETRQVVISWQVRSCAKQSADDLRDGWKGGYGWTGIDSYLVSYEFMGKTHTATVPLNTTIAVINLPHCP